jgi:hypothetical protein
VTDAAVPRSSAPLHRVLLRRVGWAASSDVGWPLAAGAICFTLTAARLATTADSYLDLVGGRWIVSHGIPHFDTISVAGHGRAWIDQQWLAQVLMYGTWRAGGHAALGFLLAMLLASAYALLTRLCIQAGVAPQRALQWALLAFLGSVGYAAIRAEMFSYLAFALTLAYLARDARRDEFGWTFAWVLVILAVWANLHGAVVLGALLVVVYCLVRAAGSFLLGLRRSAVLYGGSAVAAAGVLFATPYGFGEIPYYRGIFQNSVLRQYENEWTSPRLTYLFDWMTFAFAAIAVVVCALALWKRQRPAFVSSLALVVTAALAFHAVRYQPWFAISAAAFAAITLTGLRPRPPALDTRFLRLGAAGLACVTLIAAVQAVRMKPNATESALARGPLAAVGDWVAAHPDARVLADEKLSDRLLWSQPVTVGHVALDGRLDFYDDASLRQWFSYIFGPRLVTSIGSTSYDVFVAYKRSDRLFTKLTTSSCLRVVYADSSAVVAVRRASASGALPCGRSSAG